MKTLRAAKGVNRRDKVSNEQIKYDFSTQDSKTD